MAPVSPSLSRGVLAVSDADRLRMPGYDTRFAAGTLPPPEHLRAPRHRRRPRARVAGRVASPVRPGHPLS